MEEELYPSGGRLGRHTALGELATQFGEALTGSRGALRSMIGEWKKDKDHLLERLEEKTSHRVPRMDDQEPAGCAAWKKIGAAAAIKDLYVEVEIRGGP